MSKEEKNVPFIHGFTSNSQRILNNNTPRQHQPLYPKFFQEQALINQNQINILSLNDEKKKSRHPIFEQESVKARERSLDIKMLSMKGEEILKIDQEENNRKQSFKDRSMEVIPFENSMISNHFLKEALSKEIKENIDLVKVDLMESFRKILENFKKESFDLDRKIDQIQSNENESDGVLECFDQKIAGIYDKLQDITNKIPEISEKPKENPDIQKLFEEKITEKQNEIINVHKNIKKSLYAQKENIGNYLSSKDLTQKHQEKINAVQQNIETSSKSLKELNRGYEQKSFMIKEQLTRKFQVTQKKCSQDLENLDKKISYEKEIDVFNEINAKLDSKFKELRALTDEMMSCLAQKLTNQEVEKFLSEGLCLEEMFQPFLKEYKDLVCKLENHKEKFPVFKEDLKNLLEESQKKLKEIINKKENMVTRKCNAVKKTYEKIGEYHVEIDKLEGLLQGLSSFCEGFHEMQKAIERGNDKKIGDIKEDAHQKKKEFNQLLTTLEEMKDNQEHFSSKLELIWQKFSLLQEKVHLDQIEFFKEIENFNENKQKTPIKTEKKPVKSPLRSPLQHEFEDINMQEYLSPDISQKYTKGMKITRSPVTSLNVNAFTTIKSPLKMESMKSPLSKSPLARSPLEIQENNPDMNRRISNNFQFKKSPSGMEIRGQVNQIKLQGLSGDNDAINGRWSSIGKNGRFGSINYERLSEIGFKNCEETGFQVNEEGFVMGVDGKILLDSEARPIRLLPEYIDFLSQN